MATFRLTNDQGQTFNVTADNQQQALQAMRQMQTQQPSQEPQAPAPQTFDQAASAAGFNLVQPQTPDQQAAREAQIMAAGEAPNPLAAGLARGGTFGLSDELAAGAGSLTRGVPYDQELQRVRQSEQISREAAPGQALAGEIAGGLTTGLGAASLLKPAASTIGRVGQAAGLGAGEGALYGFGTGEGAEGRSVGAATGGTLGAALGAASVPAAALATRAVGGVKNVLSRALRSGSKVERKLNRRLAAELRAAGQTDDEILDALTAAQRQGQDVFTVADAMGIRGQRLVRGIARGTGEGSQEIQDYLQKRQAGQSERVSQFIEDAFGIKGTAKQREAALKAARAKAANEAYGEARKSAGPVNAKSVVDSIDDRIGTVGDIPETGDSTDVLFAKFRKRLTGKGDEGLTDFSRILGVKQDIQDAIGAATRAGRNNQARELQPLVDQIDEALEAASPAYRAANDQFAEASRVIEQIAEGGRAAAPRARAADVADQFGSLSPDQQGAFRQGFADPLLNRIEGATPTTNVAGRLTAPGVQQKIGTVAQDPQTLLSQIGREQQMAQTLGAAVGGSPTAQATADVAQFGGGRLAQAIRGPQEAVLGAVGDLVERFRGATADQVQSELSRILISRGADAEQALRRAGQIARMDEATRNKALRLLATGSGLLAGQGAQ